MPRRMELFDKRNVAFRVTVEMFRAVEEVRGDRPRNTWIREEALLPFLKALPRTRYVLPRPARKTTIYFELPGAVVDGLAPAMEHYGLKRPAALFRLAITWQLTR